MGHVKPEPRPRRRQREEASIARARASLDWDLRAYPPSVRSMKGNALRFPNIKAHILDLSSNKTEAYGVCNKVRVSLLTGASASLDTALGLCLEDIEVLLGTHLALVTPAAAKVGATATTVMDALIHALVTIRRGHGSGSLASASGASNPLSSAAPPAASNDAVEAVLVGQPHQALVLSLSKCDLATESGRRDAFTAGFDPNHIYAVRALTFGEDKVTRRDDALGKLGQLRPFLVEYTNYCLRVDFATGEIPSHLAACSITGADGSNDVFFKRFWKQDYVNMDWYGSTTQPGLLYFKAARKATGFKPVQDTDFYCDPNLVRELAEWGQNMFCIQGFPDVAAATAHGKGFTWRTWWMFYADHLQEATALPTRKAQQDWIDFAHAQALAALRLMGEVVHSLLTASVDIVSLKLEYLLPWDAPPAEALRNHSKLYAETEQAQRTYGLFVSGAGKTADHDAAHMNRLPLRSERHAKGVKRGSEGGSKEQANSKPRGGANDTPKSKAPSSGKPEAKEPGSLASTVGWVTPNKDFFASGLVWDVGSPKGLAASYHVTIGAKCWAFLLSRRRPANKMAVCGKHGSAGHEGPESAAHKLGDFAITEETIAQFARPPTDEERAKFAPNQRAAGRSGGTQGKGIAKKGRASGGQSFRPPARQ